MEEYLTPPTSPEVPVKKSTNKKYSTLPIGNSLVYCNEKTNLKFGSVFSLTSSDKSAKSDKKNKKISLSSTSVSVKSSPSAEEKVSKVLKSPLKLLRKLSFSKKSKNKYAISEDSMDGGKPSNIGKTHKKKGGKNKWKKVNPDDETVYSSTASLPESAKFEEREVAPSTTSNISTFLEKERGTILPDDEAKSSTTFIEKEGEGEIEEGGIKSNTITSEINVTPEFLTAPASSQELEVTTDNEEYHDVQSETIGSPRVMSEPTTSDNKNGTEIISESTSEVIGSGDNISVENTPLVSKSASDIKKEILSITTPIVTEVAARKKDKEAVPKVSFSASSTTNSENQTVSNNSPTTSVIEPSSKSGSPTNGTSKEVLPYSKMPDKREFLYKILVIGELGAGKTSIIKRYVHQFFSPHYRATIGVDFALKVLTWDQDTIIRLQLWDIAGQERFGNMTRVYYKEAVGAFIVFDVTRAATFDAVLKWKQDLDSKVQLPDGSPIPCVLLANKCDQPKEGTAGNTAKIDEFVKENNFSAWYETSAKDNINIDEAAKTLVHKILENDKVQQNGSSVTSEKVFSLNRNEKPASNGKSCAC